MMTNSSGPLFSPGPWAIICFQTSLQHAEVCRVMVHHLKANNGDTPNFLLISKTLKWEVDCQKTTEL